MGFRRGAGLALLGVAMAAPALMSGLAHADTLAHGTIAFASNRDGNSEIYVMNADGSSPTRLTTSPASDSFPVLSPNGKTILWHTNRDGNFEIYSMKADGSAPATRLTSALDADGTNPTRIPGSPQNDEDPVWSPNGKHIAFHSTRSPTVNLYVMNADGSEQTRLSHLGTQNFGADWSFHRPGVLRP